MFTRSHPLPARHRTNPIRLASLSVAGDELYFTLRTCLANLDIISWRNLVNDRMQRTTHVLSLLLVVKSLLWVVHSRFKYTWFTPSFPLVPVRFAGALTNLGDFFQNLKHNLESLEAKHLNTEQVKLLEGQNMISNLRKEFVADYPKPAGSAAFLHAIRNYRPSHRIRALVSTVPELYRGTNYHDPVYMLAGLGK
ncbi:Dper\GL11233-PA-like protein [Anopheles sinensis]|uniref:Dper\GL11233-PA-like protein n=1 Tax=Anopheles sinensis TaxID=74873 RepID=A0A084WJ99_ANOSI|nr:Dper\GL11233-PA-like protein [Anopheles sinensis]